jgi:hypothetical protein
MTTTPKQYSPKFKARVVIEAIRGEKTLSQLGSQFKVHPMQIAKNGPVASGWDSTASDQCGWARRLSAGHPRTQGQWRAGSAVPVSANSILK